jgi:hypothetical protein
MLRVAACALGLVLGGCSLDPGDDAPPPDLSDAEVHHYRITAIDLPEAAEEVREIALDLDGDGAADNLLGSVYRAMRQVYTSYEVEGPAAARLTADVGWILTIYDGREIGAGAGVRVSRGVLDGGVVTPALDEVEPSLADSLGPGFELRGGTTMVPLGIVSDPQGGAAPGWLRSTVTAVRIDTWTDATAVATIAASLGRDEVVAIVFPNLAAYFTWKLADPTADYARQLDTNDDGVVSVAEVEQDSLVRSLFAPDLEPDHLSLGVRVTAQAL